MAKVIEDVNSNYTGRVLASWLVTKVIGGTGDEHTFVNIHNITYNVFTGTSKGVYKHFWQIWQNQRFEAFDYGKTKNVEVYGSPTPINFFENYDKYDRPRIFGEKKKEKRFSPTSPNSNHRRIDIPIYFAMGLTDTLIEPVSVVTHYATLKEKRPTLANLRAFPRLGHIDFTVGANEALISFLLDTIHIINETHS